MRRVTGAHAADRPAVVRGSRPPLMVRDFESKDEGKHVMTADGEVVGTIEQIRGSDAHVKPDAGLSRSMRRKLGWPEHGDDTYQLRKTNVDSIDDDGIHLKTNL